ncbi:hypothetical protein [Mycoplasma todarodis]|uniref:hypothetical protein n=1 Tax=Mycoplasma todarodis TaxID=1937191 RepID=UPI003B2B2F90
MKNKKKAVLSLGAIAAVIAPLATTIACGNQAPEKRVIKHHSSATLTQYKQASQKLINKLTNSLESGNPVELQSAIEEYLSIANNAEMQDSPESATIKNLVNQIKKLTENNIKHLQTIKDLKEEKLKSLQKDETEQKTLIKTINNNLDGLSGMGGTLNNVVKTALQKIGKIQSKMADVKNDITNVAKTIGQLKQVVTKPAVKKSIKPVKAQPVKAAKTTHKPVVAVKNPTHVKDTKEISKKAVKAIKKPNTKKATNASEGIYAPTSLTREFNKIFDTERYNEIVKHTNLSLVNKEDRLKASKGMFNNDIFNDSIAPSLAGRGYLLETKKGKPTRLWFRKMEVGQTSTEKIGFDTVTYTITKIGKVNANGDYENVEYKKVTEDGVSRYIEKTGKKTFEASKYGDIFLSFQGNDFVYRAQDSTKSYVINFGSYVRNLLGDFINDEIVRLGKKSFATPHEIAQIILNKYFNGLNLKVVSFKINKDNSIGRIYVARK